MRGLFFIVLSAAAFGMALDVNPPAWRGDPYSTMQWWNFAGPDTQPFADGGNNPFGPMQLRVLQEVAADYDPLHGAWVWPNPPLTGLLEIDTTPNWPSSFTQKKAWVQVTWGIDLMTTSALPYNMGQLIAMSDGPGIDGIFPIQMLDSQTVGSSGTIEWYVSTFQIPFVIPTIYEDEFGNVWFTEEDAPWWGSMYVLPYNPIFSQVPPESYQLYIAGIVVDTIAVPEPMTLLLIGMGAVIMRKARRQ